jgi:hypothetical protein
MSAAACAPFGDCQDLDGRLLINTAIQGPPLAFQSGEVSFGEFTAAGAAARPYIDLSVEQRWIARDACYGPVRSIFSLAPGETVQLSVSLEQQTSFAEEIADHLPDVKSLSVSSRFEPHASVSAAPPPRPHAGTNADDAKMKEESRDRRAALQAEIEQIQKPRAQLLRSTQYVGSYGSVFEFIPDPLGLHNLLPGGSGAPPMPPTPQGLVNGVTKLITSTVGGNAPAASETVATASQAATRTGEAVIARHTRDDTTTRRTETTTRQSLTRTFSNPYRDRTLQLRFIPLFRRFDVTTAVAQAKAGVALHAGPFREVSAEQVNPLARVASDPTHARIQRPLAQLLGPDTNSAMALRWSQAETRDDSLLVPIADARTASNAIGLRGRDREEFSSALTSLVKVADTVKADTRSTHLFMGTHVEAVAGECVLQDVPPLEPAPPSG